MGLCAMDPGLRTKARQLNLSAIWPLGWQVLQNGPSKTTDFMMLKPELPSHGCWWQTEVGGVEGLRDQWVAVIAVKSEA